MRKVKYGTFVDFMPSSDESDNELIGAKAYRRSVEDASRKTAGKEYYVEEDGEKKVIKNITLAEKAIALVGYAFNLNKKKVVGVRDNGKSNPYGSAFQQLGVKVDSEGKRVVDEGYYRDAEQRALDKGDRKGADEAYKKRLETERKLSECFPEMVEDSGDLTNKSTPQK